MKKLLLSLLVLSMFISVGISNASASTIGIKGGYAMPKDDLKDFDDSYLFGVYFDMGKFYFNKLNFQPSLDYFTLETDNYEYGSIWGVHFDWYWHFMGKQSISPFLGFGPSFNYLDRGNDNTADEDSDAGVDLFAGIEFRISGTPFEMMVEGRYKMLDIADRDATVWCINLGLGYNF